MIRKAKIPDVPRIIEISAEIHKKSVFSHIKLDRKYYSDMIIHSIREQKTRDVWVDVVDEKVEGFIIGALQPMFFSPELHATDLMFGTTEKGNGYKLFRSFLKWVEGKKDVRLIVQYLGYGIPGWERTGKLYEKQGLERIGAIYMKKGK